MSAGGAAYTRGRNAQVSVRGVFVAEPRQGHDFAKNAPTSLDSSRVQLRGYAAITRLKSDAFEGGGQQKEDVRGRVSDRYRHRKRWTELRQQHRHACVSAAEG